MRIEEVIRSFEELAPLHWAEDFDNTGLLTGDPQTEVTGILVTLDTLEQVIEEALEKGCNLIISFHPIIFSGLKRLTPTDYVQRTIIKAIEHRIAIYALHTALDNSFWGVNARICEVLGLQNRQILIPKKQQIKKLTTYVPNASAEQVREALFQAGAGAIGNYDQCSFNMEGVGSFRGNDLSNPTLGERGKLHFEREIQLSVVFDKGLEKKILRALFNAHPYEEVAYEVTTLDNQHQQLGLGMVGELDAPLEEDEFLTLLKSRLKTGCIRHSALRGTPVKKVAVLGGSGAFAIPQALGSGADAFVTADLKYHDFFKAEGKILLADVGHFESEQFTKNLIVEHLRKKFTNFAIVLAVCNTNPVKYF